MTDIGSDPMGAGHSKLIPIGIGLGVLFWIIESAVEVLVFQEGAFIDRVFSPQSHEVWMRLIVAGMFIVFAVYAQSIINSRRRAEDATGRANAELDQIFETAADGMRVVDKDFNVLRVNETFAALSGTKAPEAVGRKCYDVFRGPLCHSPDCTLMRILKGEKRVECDVEKERNDGIAVPCIVTATPFRGPGGQVIGIVEDFKDITERKQAEQSLLESETKYASLVEQARDGVFIVQDEVIRFANQALAEIHGYTVQELIGMPVSKLVMPEYRDLFVERQNRRKDGETVSALYEVKALCKDGSVKDVEASAEDIQYEGRPAVMGIARDITQRKRMETELLRIGKFESIGILAGGIAHDFNNILTAILGNISLARMYINHEDKLFSILSEAEKASLRAKELTHQLVTFAVGGEPVKKTGSVADVVKGSVSLALAGSNVLCQCHMPDDLWPVEFDEGQIRDVIHNILSNAVHAMPAGGVVKIPGENVIVRAEKGNKGLPLPDGKYVKISVEDQGIGIPDEHLPLVFDPYFSTKQRGTQKGMGLGLATAFSIIKKHKGYITVESKVGAGTTFQIYLPASEKAFPETRPVKEEFIGGKGKILVMDDEEMIRDLAGRLLSRFGYVAGFARDGAEAIEMYRKAGDSGDPFDAVILDLTIRGGMGGEEAVRKLMEIDPEVKAIISSGYCNDPIMANFREHGFKGVIAKPYQARELAEALQEVLGGGA